MSATVLLRFVRRRLHWLLAFALVLPVAQGLAAVHALSHLQDGRQRAADAAELQACGACVLAGALAAGGAAAPAAPLAVAEPAPDAHAADFVPPSPSLRAARPAARGPPPLPA